MRAAAVVVSDCSGSGNAGIEVAELGLWGKVWGVAQAGSTIRPDKMLEQYTCKPRLAYYLVFRHVQPARGMRDIVVCEI